MEWTTFFLIFAISSTFGLSFGPILYQHYFGKSSSDTFISVRDIRHRPKVKIVCGNIESIPCDICTVFVHGLRALVNRQASEEEIIKFAEEVCKTFKIEDNRVCQGVVQMFKVE